MIDRTATQRGGTGPVAAAVFILVVIGFLGSSAGGQRPAQIPKSAHGAASMEYQLRAFCRPYRTSMRQHDARSDHPARPAREAEPCSARAAAAPSGPGRPHSNPVTCTRRPRSRTMRSHTRPHRLAGSSGKCRIIRKRQCLVLQPG